MSVLHGIVSTAESPAPDLTFRYLTVGIAGSLGAALLIALQPEAMGSRWSGPVLAAVHLFALGGLAPIMVGALLQIVPVAAGLSIPGWGRAEQLLLALFPLAALAMAAGFVSSNRVALAAGAVLALLALASVAIRLGLSLLRGSFSSAIQAGLGASTIGLIATLALGGALAAELALRQTQPASALVDLHALWATAGWAGVLIASVGSVIVPMFHVTDAYPGFWMRSIPAVPAILLAGSLATWLELPAIQNLTAIALAAGAMAFGALTLALLRRSRRRTTDAFRHGWIAVSIASLSCGALCVCAVWFDDVRWTQALGTCLLLGVLGLAVTTMVYRIVPFLIWLHWQQKNAARVRLPLLHEIIPARAQQYQLALQVLSAAALIASSFFVDLAAAGAWMWVLSQTALLVLVRNAIRLYRRNLDRLGRLPPARRDHGVEREGRNADGGGI